jgi:hypothetical protein
MTHTIGDDMKDALAMLVETADALPGTFRPECSLTYWSGVVGGAAALSCRFEGDIHGDAGSEFFITGQTASEVLRRASEEAWNRVPGGDA